MVGRRLKALGYEKPFIRDVKRLVELHLRTFGYTPGKWSESGVRRYAFDAGELLERLNKLIRADVTTGNPAKAARLRAGMDDLEERIRVIRENDELKARRPALDGHSVMDILGIGPGRELGEVMRHLNQLARDGVTLSPEETRQEVLRFSR